jgi:hypothetical protein
MYKPVFMRVSGGFRVSCGHSCLPRGWAQNWSHPTRAPREADCGIDEDAESFRSTRRLASMVKELDVCSHWTSGVIESDMFVQSSKRKFGTTRGSPRRSRTAKAFGISRIAAKSERACEWGGWGRLSVDGLGQNNPSRSEDPWGAGCPRPDFAVSVWLPFPDSALGYSGWSTDTKDGDKPAVHFAHAGSKLKRMAVGQVPSDMHIFQPYWGKPAVRNDRGDRGDVGIIRSPIRATILLACGGR